MIRKRTLRHRRHRRLLLNSPLHFFVYGFGLKIVLRYEILLSYLYICMMYIFNVIGLNSIRLIEIPLLFHLQRSVARSINIENYFLISRPYSENRSVSHGSEASTHLHIVMLNYRSEDAKKICWDDGGIRVTKFIFYRLDSRVYNTREPSVFQLMSHQLYRRRIP